MIQNHDFSILVLVTAMLDLCLSLSILVLVIANTNYSSSQEVLVRRSCSVLISALHVDHPAPTDWNTETFSLTRSLLRDFDHGEHIGSFHREDTFIEGVSIVRSTH
jgi:hypothetical protein